MNKSEKQIINTAIMELTYLRSLTIPRDSIEVIENIETKLKGLIYPNPVYQTTRKLE